MSDLQTLGEFGWIARQNERLARRAGVRVGIGDDGAVLEAMRAPIVTCDCLIEGVHFRRDWSTPHQLGRKTMSVNVSDIAAMGAHPVAAFVALALPKNLDVAFLDEFYAGMEEIAARFNFTIAGGDTAHSRGDLMINVTLIGEIAFDETRDSQPILRSGARVGDAILVTGTLGDAGAGLAILQNPQREIEYSSREFLLQRHLDPQPRFDEMQAALEIGGVRAALDLSDGLAGDAAHIAHASGVTLQIETAKLPLSESLLLAANAFVKAPNSEISNTQNSEMPDVDISNSHAPKVPILEPRGENTTTPFARTSDADAPKSHVITPNSVNETRDRVLDLSLRWALGGGEDYELLLCVAPEKADEIARHIEYSTGTRATIIGRCVASSDGKTPADTSSNNISSSRNLVQLLDENGAEIVAPAAWTHF